MKRLNLTLVAILIFIHFSKAQNTFPSTGNVGIGTASPSSLLTIKGPSSYGMLRLFPTSDYGEASMLFSNHSLETDLSNLWLIGTGAWASGNKFVIGNSSGPIITLDPADNKNNTFSLNAPNGFIQIVDNGLYGGFRYGTDGGKGFELRGTTTNAGELRIRVGDNSGVFQDRMIINTLGNVGIGTTNPGQSLDVNGNIRFNDKTFFGNWTLGATSQWPVNPGLTFAGGDETFGISSTGGQISLQIDGAFRQQETGKVNYFMDKVGIGTMAPSTSAEIVGPDGNHRADSKSDYQLLIRSQDDPVNPYIGIGYRHDSSVTEYGQIQCFDDFNGGYATNLILNARGGNVGVGTTSPDQKLTVNGIIHSSEVKVDTSIPVPDYVFESSYKLTDLPSVDEYLKKYHHLPEIPTAAEIEKDGLKLGEMNTLLLKKVEELTLYLIEKDKQYKDQQEINKKQQRKIDELEQKLNSILETVSKNK